MGLISWNTQILNSSNTKTTQESFFQGLKYSLYHLCGEKRLELSHCSTWTMVTPWNPEDLQFLADLIYLKAFFKKSIKNGDRDA